MSRSRIQDHFVILSQKLDVDKVVPYLREERMLTVDEHEQLSHPMYSMRQKRERLLLLLPRKGRNHFENFGKCLVWSGQGDLAERIGIDIESVPPSPYGPPPQAEPQVDQGQLFQLIQSLITPNRGTTSAPVSLTTHPQHQMVPQPGPNSMPAGYWSGGGVSSRPSHSSMYSPATPLSTGASSSQQSLPSVHPPPPTSQQLHPRPLQRPKDPQVFILYCKDDQVMGRSAEGFCDDVMDLADLLNHVGGLKCHFDGYDQPIDPTDGTPTEQHPTNWSKWTEKMIETSDFVLIVCSPSLHRCLQSHSQVEMTRGRFFANAITNVIDSHASKFIPVFLNAGCQQELVPTSLRMSTSYPLNTAEFRECLGDGEGLSQEQFTSRLSEVLQEQRFQNIVALLAHLRGESYNPRPHPPLNPIRLPAQPQPVLGPTTATYHQSYLPSGYTYHPNTSSYPYRATTTTNSGAPEIAEGDLLKIAERVPRDWQHLGIKLGVEYSILENLRTTHPSDTRSAAMEMFGIWQRTKGKHATKKALKTALLELKYGRVANEVFPND